MKKNLLLVLMVVAMAGTAFASGAQDSDNNLGRGNGRYSSRHMSGEDHRANMEKHLADQEKISISGTLVLVNGEPPVVESDGTNYRIMAPWSTVEDLNLTNGLEVSVEGYEMAGPRFQWDDSEKSLMLTKAVVNGQEIAIDPLTDHMMGGIRMGGGYGRSSDDNMGPRNQNCGFGRYNN